MSTEAPEGVTLPEGMEFHRIPRDELRVALDKLAEPFPADAVSKLPRSTCRDCTDSPRKRCDRHEWVPNCSECHGRHSSATIHLDYVGHADVTRRLLDVDPAWTWEPMALDQHGLPLIVDGLLWIRLTVAGVTRLGVGDAQGKRGPNAFKEMIGDAIRNAAMRFGVALELWSKSDAAKNRLDADHGADPEETARREAQKIWQRATRAQGLDAVRALWNEANDRDLLQYAVTDAVATEPSPLDGRLRELGDSLTTFDQQPNPQTATGGSTADTATEAPKAGQDPNGSPGESEPARRSQPSQPRMPSKAQHKMLNGVLGNAGVDMSDAGRADRLEILSTLVGRKLDSSSEITHAEMKGLLDKLQAVKTAEQLDAVVSAVLNGGGES